MPLPVSADTYNRQKKIHLHTPHTFIQTNFQAQWYNGNRRTPGFFYCYGLGITFHRSACDSNTSNNDGGVDVHNACKMFAVNFLFICLIILCVSVCAERNTNTS